jgi:polygalacturonase
VLLADYTLHNSPFWINHLVNAAGLRFDNLVIGDSRIDGRLSWQ